MKRLTVISVGIFFSLVIASAAEDVPVVGVGERLGEYVPLDLVFLDANGDSVRLGDCLDKPTILTLVYFHCPTICKPLLTNVADVVERTDIKPGKDYNLITVSFDEYDNPETATVMKRDITTSMRKVKQAGASWPSKSKATSFSK